jgi:VanZ family protein
VFIFANSVKPSAKTNSESKQIVKALTPITKAETETAIDEINKIVRKSAHAIEFATLGVFLALLADGMRKITKRRHICFPLFITLLVAVTDEFIQKYFGRTSKVSDVLIDFGGAVMGIFVVFMICEIIAISKNKKSADGGVK